MLPSNLGEMRLFSALPMSYPYSTDLSCETCLKTFSSFSLPHHDRRSGLHLLSPYCKKFLPGTCLSPLNTHSYRPCEPSALISLGPFAARKLEWQLGARFRAPLSCSPTHLSASGRPPAPRAAVIQVDLCVVLHGRCTWSAPVFPRDSAQASLGGILSRSAGWTGLTLTLTVLYGGDVLLSR